jgi:hypothetical protein
MPRQTDQNLHQGRTDEQARDIDRTTWLFGRIVAGMLMALAAAYVLSLFGPTVAAIGLRP